VDIDTVGAGRRRSVLIVDGEALFEALAEFACSLLDDRRDAEGLAHPPNRTLIDRQRAQHARRRAEEELTDLWGPRGELFIACAVEAAGETWAGVDHTLVRAAVRRKLAVLRDTVLENIEVARAAVEASLETLDVVLEEDFLAAESWFRSHAETVPREAYEARRVRFVQGWARSVARLTLDEDQAIAVAAVDGDIHVRARAGSGKTRVMVTRAAFLHLHCHVAPEQIMLVAFNRLAVEQIEARLRTLIPVDQVLPVVVTFHALARAIVNPQETLIIDDGREDRNLAEHVRAVVDEIYVERPAAVNEAMLSYLEEGCGDDEAITSPRQGFDGRWYKSKGEVRIANELFRRSVR